MSTSAIVPLSSADFGTPTATPSQQSVFQGLVGQLEQSIGGGDLTASQTLFNAIEALSPSSIGASDPLGSFLTSLDSALRDDSVSEAQSALAAYQEAAPTAAGNTPAADTNTTGTGATDSSAVAKSTAAGLVLNQVQLSLVNSLLGGGGASTSSSASSPTDPLGGLLDILNAVYAPAGSSTSAGAGAAGSASPYEALVSALQSSLASGSGTAGPALEYLSSTGNFVNTSA